MCKIPTSEVVVTEDGQEIVVEVCADLIGSGETICGTDSIKVTKYCD